MVMWSERSTSATAFLLIVLAVVDTLLIFAWLFLITAPGKFFLFLFKKKKEDFFKKLFIQMIQGVVEQL